MLPQKVAFVKIKLWKIIIPFDYYYAKVPAENRNLYRFRNNFSVVDSANSFKYIGLFFFGKWLNLLSILNKLILKNLSKKNFLTISLTSQLV